MQVRRRSHPGQADDVLIHRPDLRHALFFQGPGDVHHAIPQSCRFFKGLTVGGGFHVLTQSLQQFLVPPLKKASNLFDDAVIVRLRLVAGTGSHAAFDFKFQTGPVRGAVDVDRTRGQREHFFDDFQGVPKRPRRHVRTKIQCPVVRHAAHNRETGKILFHRQSEIGIVLVVPQDDVEPRTMAFDQIAFQQKRLQFRRGDDRFNVMHQGHQYARFGTRVAAFLEI